MNVTRKQRRILQRAIEQWQQEGVLNSSDGQRLSASLSVRTFDWQRLSRYAFWTAIACVLIALGSLFADAELIAAIINLFSDSAVARIILPTLLAIGGQFDLPTILGAEIVGGCIAIVFGIFVKYLRVFFPPLVTGTVIFTIGLSLYPTAVKYMAGGAGSEGFGSWQNWTVALITLAVVIFCNHFTKGVFKLASILIGMVVGYIVALAMGMVSFSAVAQSGWFAVTAPLHFGITFNASACISLAVMYIVNSVQTIGDLTSTTIGGLDREPTDRELSGGIVAQGVMSVAGAFFGGLPAATFSQNVGIVTVNRVVNRIVFAFAACVLLVAGFVPKFASLLTTIPQCVIGGATISVFATITMTGIRMITSAKLTQRNVAIVGLSVALGVGVTTVEGCLSGFPSWVATVFGSSSVVIATLTAIFLNLILPKESGQNQ